jgi:hypothetical protein
MKKLFLYLLPLFVAFAAMIVVNEYCRMTSNNSSKSRSGYTTMNSRVASPDVCTWKCYSDTTYCKQHHVKVLGNLYWLFDPLYFGMISVLLMTGSYGAANVIFLVIIWPLLISYLLVRVNKTKEALCLAF